MDTSTGSSTAAAAADDDDDDGGGDDDDAKATNTTQSPLVRPGSTSRRKSSRLSRYRMPRSDRSPLSFPTPTVAPSNDDDDDDEEEEYAEFTPALPQPP